MGEKDKSNSMNSIRNNQNQQHERGQQHQHEQFLINMNSSNSINNNNNMNSICVGSIDINKSMNRINSVNSIKNNCINSINDNSINTRNNSINNNKSHSMNSISQISGSQGMAWEGRGKARGVRKVRRVRRTGRAATAEQHLATGARQQPRGPKTPFNPALEPHSGSAQDVARAGCRESPATHPENRARQRQAGTLGSAPLATPGDPTPQRCPPGLHSPAGLSLIHI